MCFTVLLQCHSSPMWTESSFKLFSGWRLLLPVPWFHSQSTIQKISSKICGLFVFGPLLGHTLSHHAEKFSLLDCACVKPHEYEMNKYYFIIGDDDDDDVYSDSSLVCNQWVCYNYFRCSREAGGNSFREPPGGVEEVWLSVLRSASGIKAETWQDAAPQAQQRSDSSSWLTAESESAALFVTFQKLLFNILFVFLWKGCLFSSPTLWPLLVETESLFHFFFQTKAGCVSPQMANPQRSWIAFAALVICLLVCWSSLADAFPPKPESPGSNASPEDWAKYQAAVRHYVNLITRQRSAQKRV